MGIPQRSAARKRVSFYHEDVARADAGTRPAEFNATSSLKDRFKTMAIPSMDLPRRMALAHQRPVVTIRARRGGRRNFPSSLWAFGERAIQILDADGYVLLVVESTEEITRLAETLVGALPDTIEINMWNGDGERLSMTSFREQ